MDGGILSIPRHCGWTTDGTRQSGVVFLHSGPPTSVGCLCGRSQDRGLDKDPSMEGIGACRKCTMVSSTICVVNIHPTFKR